MISQVTLLDKSILHLEKLDRKLDKSCPDPTEELVVLQAKKKAQKEERSALDIKRKELYKASVCRMGIKVRKGVL